MLVYQRLWQICGKCVANLCAKWMKWDPELQNRPFWRFPSCDFFTKTVRFLGFSSRKLTKKNQLTWILRMRLIQDDVQWLDIPVIHRWHQIRHMEETLWCIVGCYSPARGREAHLRKHRQGFSNSWNFKATGWTTVGETCVSPPRCSQQTTNDIDWSKMISHRNYRNSKKMIPIRGPNLPSFAVWKNVMENNETTTMGLSASATLQMVMEVTSRQQLVDQEILPPGRRDNIERSHISGSWFNGHKHIIKKNMWATSKTLLPQNGISVFPSF